MECGVHSGAVIVSSHKRREGFYHLMECQILSARIKSGPCSINCNPVAEGVLPLNCVRGVGGNKRLEWNG